MKNGKVGVAIVGSKFISTIHAEALKTFHEAEILAVASPTVEHSETFTKPT